MAEESIKKATLGSHLPIAQLTPLLPAPSSRSIKAAVTLIWPYSSATNAVAFLLAEPDFRLRRSRGQVRAQFGGSSAEAIKRSGIESGDEITLCLDGVEFVNCEAAGTPGIGVEFELRFTERLLLEFRKQETHDLSVIDINHPQIDAEGSSDAAARTPSPETEPLENGATFTPARPEIKLADDEFSSPAFIKRARTSYGSLWEDELDLEDGTVRGKGRKRTRLSSAWTLASRSPTPELEDVGTPEVEAATIVISPDHHTIQAPAMADEGVQTEALEVGASEALLEFARQSMEISQNGFNMERSLLAGSDISAQEQPGNFTSLSPNRQQAMDTSSPRLHPLSFDSLGSPLLSQTMGNFVEPVENRSSEQGSGGFMPSLKVSQLNEQTLGVVYASSHASHPEDHVSGDFQGFDSTRLDLNDLQTGGVEQPVDPEDQYGHWQSEMAQLSYEASEHPLQKQDGNDSLDVEEHYDQPYEHERFRTSPDAEVPIQQYPDLDEISSGNSRPSAWQDRDRHVSQPYSVQLDHDDNLDELVRSLSRPQSRPISPSAIAQSALIDLTESDDEDDEEELEDYEEEDGDQVGGHLQPDSHFSATSTSRGHHEYPEDYERGSDEEREQFHDQNDPPIEKAHPTPRTRSWESEEEEEDEMEDEVQAGDEYYDEDDLDAQGNPYPPGFNERNEGQLEVDDNEESYEVESYDEEEGYSDVEMDHDPPTHVQQTAPVVIDLLSSDDEDDGPSELASMAPEGPYERSDSDNSVSSGDESDRDAYENVDRRQRGAAEPRISTKYDVDNAEEESVESENESDEDDLIEESREIHAPSELIGPNDGESHASMEDDEQDPTQADISSKEFAAESVPSDVSVEEENENVKIPNDDVDEVEIPYPTALASKGDSEPKNQPGTPPIGNESADHDQNLAAEGDARESSPPVARFNIKEHARKLTSERRSLFSRVFSIDGANDEPEDQFSYPALPHVEPSSTTSIENSQNLSQTFGVRFPIGSAQLPTPDDTQAQENLAQHTLLSSPIFNSKVEIEGSTEVSTTAGETSQINPELSSKEISSADEPSLNKTLSDAVVSQEPAFTPETPRRSHRRVRSTSKVIENADNARLASPFASPSKSNKASSPSDVQNAHKPPVVIVDKPSVQKGHDASIEIGLSSLESPEKHHDLRRPAMIDLKLRLSRNLRTELEEFKPLKILRYELNKKLDVLAIVTTTPPAPERVKNGPRHYMVTFNVTDPSIAPSGVTEVQIFRPYKDALPTVKVGDGILLRNFQVISLKNRGFGLRSDAEISSWAVFKGADDVEVKGPPVEYGDGEKNHVAQMKEWYENLDSVAVAKLRRANGEKSAGV